MEIRANASTHVGQFIADGGFEPITEGEITAVAAPSLIITGGNSPMLFRRMATLLASLLPNSSSFEVPSASHVMHFENPAAFNPALLRFLTDAESPR